MVNSIMLLIGHIVSFLWGTVSSSKIIIDDKDEGATIDIMIALNKIG